MTLTGGKLYVANDDAVVAFPYADGQTQIIGVGEKVFDLPGGPINHHWTKNVVASPDGTKLYATVGSKSRPLGLRRPEANTRAGPAGRG